MSRFFIFLMILVLQSACNRSVGQGAANTKVPKQALKHFMAAQESFSQRDLNSAYHHLSTAVEIYPNYIDALFTMGGIELNEFKDYQSAYEHFKQCSALQKDYHSLQELFLAEAAFQTDRFEETKIAAQNYLDQESVNNQNRIKAEQLLRNAQFAPDAMANPVEFTPVPLPVTVNSRLDEYFPALTVDGRYLYFTRQFGQGRTLQEDVFYSELIDGTWSIAQSIGDGVNTLHLNEGAHTIAPGGKYLFVTCCERRDGYGSCDIYISKKTGDIWGKVRNLGKNINSPGWESQPSISADGKKLFFVSKRRGGYGKADIYMSELGANGQFGKAVNLGSTINTEGQEERPFLHPDGQSLYFTSTGHAGMGQSDIFVARRQPDQTWGEPANLGYPINTKNFDSGIFVGADGETAYFASDRADSINTLDIYTFKLPISARANLVSHVRGLVIDAKTGAKLAANVIIRKHSNQQTFLTTTSDPQNGLFLSSLPKGDRYALTVDKEGYDFYSEIFDLEKGTNSKPFEIIVKLKKNGEQILRNVLFASNSHDLLPESHFELDLVVESLQKYPNRKIEIQGHTDNVGSSEDNQQLSERRAKAVRDFLIAGGIAADRLTFKGYGESQPEADNETEEGRSRNRRTVLVPIEN